MYTKKNYSFWMTFNWSKMPFIFGLMYSLIICFLAKWSDFAFSLPWNPLGVIGIAVAFYLGFKNNSSYDRTWEARKIWGGIVNSSRTFGVAVVAFLQGDNSDKIKKELLYRHIAWIKMLTLQLRTSRPWEHLEDRLNGLQDATLGKDYELNVCSQVQDLLSDEDLETIKGTANMATQILKVQSIRLQELRNQNYFDDFRHMEFHQLITSFYTEQGRSERIKNFPFPRQYASTAMWMTVVFAILVPIGMVGVFKEAQGLFYWICPFLSALIIWIFFLMEKIGDYSENPFEGTYNDVPITSIATGIETDLKQMINDDNLPAPIKDHEGFLM